MDIYLIRLVITILLFYTNDSYELNDTDSSVEQSNSRASSIAQKAAVDAAAAHEAQQIAAEQASQQVKQQLAEKALEAAEACEAAVAGKQSVVEQIECELHNAEDLERKDTNSLQQGQAFLNAALQTAQQSQAEVKLLTNTLQVAQANAANAQQASLGVQEDMNEKQKILDMMKTHTDSLNKQLASAKEDLKNTKKAAAKSCIEAHKAKADAMKNRRKASKRSREMLHKAHKH